MQFPQRGDRSVAGGQESFRRLADYDSQVGSKYRAAIGPRGEARGGVIVHTMATTSNKAARADGQRDAFDLAVTATSACQRAPQGLSYGRVREYRLPIGRYAERRGDMRLRQCTEHPLVQRREMR